jgi:hypothetical protein
MTMKELVWNVARTVLHVPLALLGAVELKKGAMSYRAPESVTLAVQQVPGIVQTMRVATVTLSR